MDVHAETGDEEEEEQVLIPEIVVTPEEMEQISDSEEAFSDRSGDACNHTPPDFDENWNTKGVYSENYKNEIRFSKFQSGGEIRTPKILTFLETPFS